MTTEEISDLYIRIAFQYVSTPTMGIYFALDKSLSTAALPHFGLPDGEGIPFA